MRAFHLQLLLTNNSTLPVPDAWVPDYVTGSGKGGSFCYFGYSDGRSTAVMPGAIGDVTFFTVLQPGDFVQRVFVTINNQVVQLCLDGSGSQAPCQ